MTAKGRKRTSTSARPRLSSPPADRLGRQLVAAHLIAASREHSHLPLDVYSLTAEVIAERCGVSVATALRWKLGQSPIPYTAAVVLSGDLGAISPEWRGWRVLNGALITPDGERISEADLIAAIRDAGEYGYSSITQFAKDLQEQLEQKAVRGLEEQPSSADRP